MGVDPKARKPCEWCGRTMRPHYKPNRGHYESEHWERAWEWAKRRFCSRRCQNFVMARRRVYVEVHKERNDRIRRLRGLGLTLGQIAAEVGTTRAAVTGVLHADRARARGERVLSRERLARENAERAKPARKPAARNVKKRDRGRTR